MLLKKKAVTNINAQDLQELKKMKAVLKKNCDFCHLMIFKVIL